MIDSDLKNKLLQKGFEYVSSWRINGNRIKLESLDWAETSGWIYAFVSSEGVRYIGITSMVLRSRMDGYRDQVNDRVNSLIRECLVHGGAVHIYGLRRPGAEQQDLEKEEYSLMSEFATDWNVRR